MIQHPKEIAENSIVSTTIKRAITGANSSGSAEKYKMIDYKEACHQTADDQNDMQDCKHTYSIF